MMREAAEAEFGVSGDALVAALLGSRDEARAETRALGHELFEAIKRHQKLRKSKNVLAALLRSRKAR